MGQLALGFRSLLIRLAIFFVMAALLAWALGGTLWPRAEIADFDSVSFGGREWHWRLAVGGTRTHAAGRVRWTLMSSVPGQDPAPFDERTWVEIAGPIATDTALYYAGRTSFNPNEPWRIEMIDGDTGRTVLTLPDRLAIERQFERLRTGLDLQTPDIIRRQRPLIIDPSE